MNLSPNDIRRKQFDKGFRGYDPTEVDLFLKQAADRLAEANEEKDRAEARTREIEAKLVHYERVELALQEALESARETARSTAASAEEKARLIIQEAELRAETILRDAERERHGLRQDIVRLSSRQAEAAARLRGFLMSELEVLAQFQGDDPVGFIRLQPANPGSFPSQPARLEAPMSEDPKPWAAPGETDTESAPPEPSAPDSWAGTSEPSGDAWSDPAASSDPEPYTPARMPFAPADPPPSDGLADAQEPSATESPLTGAYASAPESPAPESSEDGPPTPPAVTGGWDLRSLVTGEERSVVASDEERDRIRRILDDLD
ncbi:hypothetical protein B1759_03775 [Rubrivirga sp. SAORIC476]|uniref:DivIVA domain-containing protein n=1 Tax=Rubrivirga sp. SAORIC476 TaxID=1961794 RepID=UPI000BA9B1D8|nr:DivIVA domain-containing protein [Rubrivirga sp. SAORIC476]PAP80512.1 hypothetical protein B1759_03775 [Rubrivirga sp. SAORIC476]